MADDAAAKRPKRMAIPLSPLKSLAQVRVAWTEAPLCRRILRGAQRWALLLAALLLLSQIAYFVFIWVVLREFELGLARGFGRIYLAFGVQMTLLGLWWIGCAAAPVLYARWVHRRFWTEDEMLRASPIPAGTRVRAVLAAAALFMAIAFAPSIALGWMPSFLDTDPTKPVPTAIGGVLLVTIHFASATLAAIVLATWMALATAKCLVRDKVTGLGLGRGWAGVLLVYVVVIPIALPGEVLRDLTTPVFIDGAAALLDGVVQRDSPAIGAALAGLVSNALTAYLMLAAARFFAARDLPILLELYGSQAAD